MDRALLWRLKMHSAHPNKYDNKKDIKVKLKLKTHRNDKITQAAAEIFAPLVWESI